SVSILLLMSPIASSLRLFRLRFCYRSVFFVSFIRLPHPQRITLFPYTTLFRSQNSSLIIVRRDDVFDRLVAKLIGLPVSQPDERSEEHTSELQSRVDLVCRLLLEKKNAMLRRIEAHQGINTAIPDISWKDVNLT